MYSRSYDLDEVRFVIIRTCSFLKGKDMEREDFRSREEYELYKKLRDIY